MTMDIKIETATVKAGDDKRSLKEDWTVEVEEPVIWPPVEIQIEEVGKILMEEILKDQDDR